MLMLLMTSCGSWFYCNVSSYGSNPPQKGYYIIPADSTLIEDFEYIEYSSILKSRLNEVGYTESSSENADLRIILDYFMGNERYVGSTTSTYNSSFTFQNGKINSNTNANANVKVRGNSATANVSSSTLVNSKNTTQTIGSSSTTESAQYETPIGVNIIAFDNYSDKPVWKVEVRDILRSGSSATFRSVMPWLIASAQPYFGTNYEGQPTITKSNGEKMGLKWPY